MNRKPRLSVVFVLAAVLSSACSVSFAGCLNDPGKNPNAPLTPTLRLGKMMMQLQPTSPWCVPADTDVSFPVQIVGNSDIVLDDPNDILIHEKDSSGSWQIRGKYNLTDKRVHLRFSGDLVEGDYYDYEIRVKDVGMLDPTGRIINSSVLQSYVGAILQQMATQAGAPIQPLMFIRGVDSAE